MKRKSFYQLKETVFKTLALATLMVLFFTGNLFAQGAGNALNFSQSYVNLGNISDMNFTANDDFSISMWFSGSENSSFTYLIGKGSGEAPSRGWVVGTNQNTLQLELVYSYNAGSDEWLGVRGSTNIRDQQWHHLAVTHSGTNGTTPASIKLYVDGQEETSRTIVWNNLTNTDITNSDDVFLGCLDKSWGNFDLTGNLDEVQVWDVVLTQSQIQNLMNREISSSSLPAGLSWNSDLLGYWKMNESSGNTVSDSHDYGTDYDGTAYYHLGIDNCENLWTANSNVTASLVNSIYPTGQNHTKLVVDAAFTTGIAGYRNFSAKDISACTKIGFWIKSSVATSAGDLQIALDNTNNCTSPEFLINAPALTASEWTYVKTTIGLSSATAIVSAGINTAADHGSMDVYVDEIRALDATLPNDRWKASGAALGEPGNALNFDGSDEYAFATKIPMSVSDNLTLEAWVKWGGQNTSNNNQFILFRGHRSDQTNGQGYGIMLDQANNHRLTIFLGGKTTHPYLDGISLPADKWTHLAAVRRSGVWEFYINGAVQIVTNSSLAPTAPTSGGTSIAVNVASSLPNARYFKGEVDEARFWSVARTEDQIRENMFSLVTQTQTSLGLQAYYRFDHSSGTTLTDLAGDNDLTLYNMESGDWIESYAWTKWIGDGSDNYSSNWTTAANWSAGKIPSSTNLYGGVHIQNIENTCLLPNGADPGTCINFYISESANFSGAENSTVNVYGNIFNFGTLAMNNADLNINGSYAAQNIFGSGANFRNLSVNNSSKGFNVLLHDSQTLTVSGYLTNTSGKTTIYPNKKLTANSVTLTDSLIIKSDDGGTGSFIPTTVSGSKFRMQRYIAAADWGTWDDGWHFLSAPVAAQTISPEFVHGYALGTEDFFKWDEPTNSWINIKNDDGTAWTTGFETDFVVGRGYMAAYQNNVTKDFTGTLNVADVSVSGLGISSGNNRSWHLLGNPFSSAISWYSGWTTTNIAGTAKIWNEANKSYTDLGSGAAIPATNGFMVQVSSGTGSLTIPASARTHSSDAFYKSGENAKIMLTAKNLDHPSAQESVISTNPLATEGFDLEYDSDFLAGYAPQFYSVAGSDKLSTNCLPVLTPETVIPFNFIKNEGTNFAITASGLEDLPGEAMLYDKKAGINHNLSSGGSYYFISEAGDDPDRFRFHFGAVGIAETTNNSAIEVLVNDGLLRLFNPKHEQIHSVQVSDVLGRNVYVSQNTGSSGEVKIRLPNQTGYYFIVIHTDDQVIQQKVFIQ